MGRWWVVFGVLGSFSSREVLRAPSNRGEGVPGGSWPWGLWAGSEEGLGEWRGQQSPRNPCLSPLPPWFWRLSAAKFAVGFCAKNLSSLGLSFPTRHTGSLVLFPWSDVGTVGGVAGMKNPPQTVKGCRERRHGHLGMQGWGRQSCSGFPTGLGWVQSPLPPWRALPPSRLPPCQRGALAPGMPRAADSLINSGLGHGGEHGRARAGPGAHRTLRRSVCARGAGRAAGRPAGSGEPRSPGGRAFVCRGLRGVRVAVFVSVIVIWMHLPVCIPQAVLWAFGPQLVSLCGCAFVDVCCSPSQLPTRSPLCPGWYS